MTALRSPYPDIQFRNGGASQIIVLSQVVSTGSVLRDNMLHVWRPRVPILIPEAPMTSFALLFVGHLSGSTTFPQKGTSFVPWQSSGNQFPTVLLPQAPPCTCP